MRKLRDFAPIRDFLSDWKIEELQVAVEERREAHMRRAGDPEAEVPPGGPIRSISGPYSSNLVEGEF